MSGVHQSTLCSCLTRRMYIADQRRPEAPTRGNIDLNGFVSEAEHLFRVVIKIRGYSG